MDVVILTIGFRPNLGGLETHLTDLTNELSKKIRVLVVTLPPISSRIPAKTVESSANLTIWRVPWFGKGIFYKLLNWPILEFFYLTPPLVVGLLFALIRYPRLKVIHAQGISGGLTAVLIGKLFRKKVVISTHYVYHFTYKGYFDLLTLWVYKQADRVLCVSEASKAEMLKGGVSKDRIGKCAYWIDLESFTQLDKKVADMSALNSGDFFQPNQ